MTKAPSGSGDSWLAGYLDRGRTLQDNLSTAITSVLEATALDLKRALARLRKMRADFTPRFCLLLHPTRVDMELAEVFATRYGFDPADSAIRRAARPPVGKIMTAVMCLLDLNAGGLHLVMLERRTKRKPRPDGPLRIAPPDVLWQPTFRALAELSHVLIAVTGISVGLQAELNYLADQGLDGRLLMTGGHRLFWRDPSTRKERSWPLHELAAAVAHVAAQPVRPQRPERARAGRTKRIAKKKRL